MNAVRKPGDIVIEHRKFWRVGTDGRLKPIMLQRHQSFNGSMDHKQQMRRKREENAS